MMVTKMIRASAIGLVLLAAAACQSPAATASPEVPSATVNPPSVTPTDTATSPTDTSAAVPAATDTAAAPASNTPAPAAPAIQSMAPLYPGTTLADSAAIHDALGALGRIAYFQNNTLYTVRPDGADPKTIAIPEGLTLGVSWSPDGQRLAFSAGYRIGIAQANDAGYVVITGSDQSAFDPAWSPDGEWIAYISDKSGREIPDAPIQGMVYEDLFVMRTDGTDARSLSPDLPIHSSSPDWSPGGQWIVFRYGDQISIVDTASGAIQPVTTDEACTNDNPVWSNDGEWIAFSGDCGRGRKLFLLSVADPGSIFELRPLSAGANWAPDNPAWSPDDRFIAFDNNGKVNVIDLPSLAVREVAAGLMPAWSPDGVE